MLYGYCRVSTNNQDLTIQEERLIKYGVEQKNIFSEKISGVKTLEERTQLEKLISKLKVNDKLVITKLDRLGRSTSEMLFIFEILKKKSVELISLDDHIDTSGVYGKMIFTIISAVAEAERARILERTKEGWLKAKELGIKFGRKRNANYQAIIEEYQKGMKVADIAKKFSVHRANVYYIIKQHCNK